MNILQTWVASPGAIALGWTLVHSLWEGAAVALALAGALSVLRSSRARYAAGCLAMSALLIAFGVTFARMLPQPGSRLPLPAEHPAGRAIDVADAPWNLSRAKELQDYLPWMACCWIAGVVFFQMRGAASWFAAQRLRRTGVFPAPDGWRSRLQGLQARIGVSRPVELLESYLADAPVVMGYLRPVILVPAGLLTGLSTGQIESILLHELAHIRRNDYLVNLGQILAEGLLFYHPAVWWISSVIRAERENCCDDLVVGTCGNVLEYAAALAALEENRTEMALAASGGSLVQRVRRLLGQPREPKSSLTPVISALVLTATLVAGLAAWQPPAAKTEDPYAKWLKEDVVYIIQDPERAAFRSLGTNEERERFIEQFWEVRNPVPGSAVNDFKAEHYRRLAYANARFGDGKLEGWKTDRGRVYIKYGPPDEIESHPSRTAATPPFEEWMYHNIEGVGRNVIVRFEDEARTGEYRMTRDPR